MELRPLLCVLFALTMASGADDWAPPLSAEEFAHARNMSLPEKTPDEVMNLVCAGKKNMTGNDAATDRVYNANARPWAHGEIPYQISGAFNAEQRLTIAQGIALILDEVPCVSIFPRTSQTDHVEIVDQGPDSSCFANIGNIGGRNVLNLERPGCATCPHCVFPGVTAHEFVHQLGGEHEQNRPDRDAHVSIVWANMEDGAQSQFWRGTWEGDAVGTPCWELPGPNFDNCVSGRIMENWRDLPYDFNSLMHYGPRAFSRNGQQTIVRRNGDQNFGQTSVPSPIDVTKMKRAYGCETPLQATSLGCYSDSASSRTLTTYLADDIGGNTNERCAWRCKSRGFRFSGTEFARECFCGNNSPPASRARPDSECSSVCPGDERERCGAGNRINVMDLENGGSGGIEYVGCVFDSSVRTFPEWLQPDSQNTNQRCAARCAQAGYGFSGTEWYTECFCSNSRPGSSLIRPDSQCNTPCSGDNSQACGGGWRLSVYSTGASPPPPPSLQYLGCYAELPNRLLPVYLTLDNQNTNERCAQRCRQRGYSISGTEWYTSCFCGSAIPSNAIRVADSQCNTPCSGDSSQMCGGGWRVSVYRS